MNAELPNLVPGKAIDLTIKWLLFIACCENHENLQKGDLTTTTTKTNSIRMVVFFFVIIFLNTPGAIPCPLWSPNGLDGVLQSIVTSLRSTVSISTALKNATD